MSAEVLSRLNHFKSYINELSEHISINDNVNAVNAINKFKKMTLKENPQQHANQFLLDCLKAKNEKLKAELENLQLEKKNKTQKINQKRLNNSDMKEVHVGIFLSRLSVTLNEVKKVQYDDVAITCNYKLIMINSLVGKKYKDYPLAVDCITSIDEKGLYVQLQYTDNKKLSILVKFSEEKELKRWVLCIKLGMMIENSRKKEKLFEVKKEESEPPSSPPPVQTQISSSLNPNPKHSLPHVPSLAFRQTSPSEIVSIIEERREQSGDASLNDKNEKNTERSLVNALSIEKSVEKRKKYSYQKEEKSMKDESFGGRSSQVKESTTSPIVQHKYQQNRPPVLTRFRGMSQSVQNNSFELSKIYKGANSIRKNSEDLWKPLINNVYHQKMLQTKKQRQIENDDKSDSVPKNILPEFANEKPQLKEEKSQKLKSARQKIDQLLNKEGRQSKLETVTPAFQLETHQLNWAGIEEMEDQNKSKSSKFSKEITSRRGSMIPESVGRSSNDSKERKRASEKEGEHISELSEEQSPMFSKGNTPHTLALPKTVSYSNGPALRLWEVEKSPDKDTEEEGEKSNEVRANYQGSEQPSSESQSHNQSQPQSHQNHTQSEDNNARAQQLKQGIVLTKCSQNGFWSHQKIVYLSQNQQDLCSRDLSDKKIKKIKISCITKIEYKLYEKGIIKHISKIEPEKCLIIRALMEDNKEKTFQFYGNNSEALFRFSQNLNLFYEHTKKR